MAELRMGEATAYFHSWSIQEVVQHVMHNAVSCTVHQDLISWSCLAHTKQVTRQNVHVLYSACDWY